MSTLSLERSTSESILRDAFARKTNKNPGYSLRAFARDLGVSHTYLSLVFNGKKALSLKKVIHFSQMLDLGESGSASFIRAGSREARGRAVDKLSTPSKHEVFSVADEYFELEADRFRLLSDWYHLPILDLTLIKGFKSDVRWIAYRLDISTAQARDGIDRLIRVGLLRKEGKTLFKNKSSLLVRPKSPSAAVRTFHQQMLGKALKALESGTASDMEARDITGSTIPVDPRRLPEAKKRIAKFRLALMKFLSEGDSSELYQMNIQLFPLSVPERPKKLTEPRGGRI